MNIRSNHIHEIKAAIAALTDAKPTGPMQDIEAIFSKYPGDAERLALLELLQVRLDGLSAFNRQARKEGAGAEDHGKSVVFQKGISCAKVRTRCAAHFSRAAAACGASAWGAGRLAVFPLTKLALTPPRAPLAAVRRQLHDDQAAAPLPLLRAVLLRLALAHHRHVHSGECTPLEDLHCCQRLGRPLCPFVAFVAFAVLKRCPPARRQGKTSVVRTCETCFRARRNDNRAGVCSLYCDPGGPSGCHSPQQKALLAAAAAGAAGGGGGSAPGPTAGGGATDADFEAMWAGGDDGEARGGGRGQAPQGGEDGSDDDDDDNDEDDDDDDDNDGQSPSAAAEARADAAPSVPGLGPNLEPAEAGDQLAYAGRLPATRALHSTEEAMIHLAAGSTAQLPFKVSPGGSISFEFSVAGSGQVRERRREGASRAQRCMVNWCRN